MSEDLPTDDVNSLAQRPQRAGIRWWPAALIALLSGAIVVGQHQRIPDRTDFVIAVYQTAMFTILALLAWWCFASRLRLRAKILGLLAAGTIGAGFAVGSVRSIEFTGDMVPRFHWRWEADGQERAAAWFRENADSEHAAVDLTDDPLEVTSADWPRYCGFSGDRTIDEPKPDFDWDTNPPQELWRHPVGEAWSSFAIVGPRLFTQEQRGEQECVTCYQADTGAELWRHEDEARYSTAMGGTGPRATPTVTNDALFALGATGILNCLDPVSGEPIWQRNILEDSGAKILDWAMSGSPLVHDDAVIVDAGGHNGRSVIAYDRSSGDIVWTSGSHNAGYAAPRIEDIAGQTQLLIFHGDGLSGLDLSTGDELWEYPFTNMYHINVAQPMKFESSIFISNGYDGGCTLIDPTSLSDGVPDEVWPPNRNLKLKFNEAVPRDGFVYGLDDGILACLDVSTGERLWKGGRYRHGQVLRWDDVLLVQAEAGYVAIVKATPDAFTEVTRFAALSDRDDGLSIKAWNVPVVNRGRLYMRDAHEMACYQLILP